MVLIIKCKAFQDETQDLFQWRIPLRPALRAAVMMSFPVMALLSFPVMALLSFQVVV